MFPKNYKTIVDQNGEILENVSGADFQAGYTEATEVQVQSSAYQTMLNRAKQLKIQQAQNDNNGDNGGDDNTPSPAQIVIEDTVEDNDGKVYHVYIDVDEVSKRTHFSKNELVELCRGTKTDIVRSTNFTELSTFITVNQGASSTAKKLAKKKQLPPELRLYFLRKAQGYGYLWLKGEVQLGQEIRKIAPHMGKRTDLKAANDNQKKQRNTSNMDDVLTELRSKKEILSEDYGIGYTQAGQLARLTEELIEKEMKYCVKNNEIPTRTHALSFLNQPPELTDDEKDEVDVEKAQKIAKAKFKFETVFSEVPFERRKCRKLKKELRYASFFACVGSCEYYLPEHGFKCVLANERDKDRAEYWQLMHPGSEDVMVQGDFRKHFDELVQKFRDSKAELLICGIPCQDFCSQKGKDWRNDDRLTLILDYVKFVKLVKPKYLVLENAKQFFSFSLPLTENLIDYHIAKDLQSILNGRTIGQYLQEELEPEGYTLNFSIEDACYYGTAQSRIRSIMLGSLGEIWKFPKAEEFAMALFEAIGHLPSLEAGKDSGIPYHYSSVLHQDKNKATQVYEALAHTATGRRTKDNDPQYQLSGWGFFGAKGTRKFWDKPSNTLDSGNGNVLGLRTVHPGRQRKDGTYSDCRPLTLLEVFLVNGLPQNYEVPKKFRAKETFIREVMGEIMLPRLLERICLELPVAASDWEETKDKK